MADEFSEPLTDAFRMRMIIYGHLLSRAVCTVARLGIPDLLDEGPRPAGQLAEMVQCRPDTLHRLLWALTAFDVLESRGDEGFGLTPLGRTLTSAHPATALPTALIAEAAIGDCWNALDTAVRAPAEDPDEPLNTPFDSVFGTDFFSYLAEQPQLRDEFYRSQTAGLRLELSALLDLIKPDPDGLIIDVGGGDGVLLAAVLDHHPLARGVLVEQASVLDAARRRFAILGIGGRCEAVLGNFFTEIPQGGDIYLLRHVLHDWDDESCVKILRTCQRSMAAGSRLVVVETLLAPKPSATADWLPYEETKRMAVIMDLYMMTVVGGAERSQDQFASLLARAGFEVRAISLVAPGVYAIEAGVAR